MENLLLNLALYSPEVILSLTLCFALIIQMASKNPTLTFVTSIIGLVVAAIDVCTLSSYVPQFYFSGHLSHDPFSLFFKLFFIIVTLFTLFFGYQSYEIPKDRHGEFYLMTLSVSVGMCTLISSVHLLTLYLSLELVSIVSYALAGFRKDHPPSNEAAIKYLLYGAMASGTMLWGLSLLFGLSGSLNLYSIHASLTSSYISPLTLITILVFLLFGFGFKMAIVPFHMWAPDVYHGAPTPTAAFFTVAPKAAGFAFFIRVFYILFSDQSSVPTEWTHLAHLNWPGIIAVISAITMTLGNLSALFQKDAKRMLAYSSIAHAGYMLLGLTTLNEEGISAVLFYLVVYFLMNFGAFFVVGMVGNTFKNDSISNFKGLGWKSPAIGIAMAIFLLSLTGIPPLGGFIGKVYLFTALVKKEIYWLLIIAIINTVISLYYYAYVIREMFLLRPDPQSSTIALSSLQMGILLFLTVPTVGLGIYWEPLTVYISKSLQFLIQI